MKDKFKNSKVTMGRDSTQDAYNKGPMTPSANRQVEKVKMSGQTISSDSRTADLVTDKSPRFEQYPNRSVEAGDFKKQKSKLGNVSGN